MSLMKKLDLCEIARDITPEEQRHYSLLRPEQVFALSDRQKIRLFYSLRVKHCAQDEASREIARFLAPSTDAGLLTLLGQSGSGKAALAGHAARSIWRFSRRPSWSIDCRGAEGQVRVLKAPWNGDQAHW